MSRDIATNEAPTEVSTYVPGEVDETLSLEDKLSNRFKQLKEEEEGKHNAVLMAERKRVLEIINDPLKWHLLTSPRDKYNIPLNSLWTYIRHCSLDRSFYTNIANELGIQSAHIEYTSLHGHVYTFVYQPK